MKRMILSAAIAAAMTFGVAVSAGAQDTKKEGQQMEQTDKKDGKHCEKKDGKHCDKSDKEKKGCCNKDKKGGKHCDKTKKDEAKKEMKWRPQGLPLSSPVWKAS